MVLATDMAVHSNVVQSFEELLLESTANELISPNHSGRTSSRSPASFSDAMSASEDALGLERVIIVDLRLMFICTQQHAQTWALICDQNDLDSNAKHVHGSSVPKVYSQVLSACLHAADISHSARSWNVHSRWTARIISEFHQQGDLEKGLHMPISPGCDRALLESDDLITAEKARTIAKGQLFFGKTFARPLLERFAKLHCVDFTTVLKTLDVNVDRWSKVFEYGFVPAE